MTTPFGFLPVISSLHDDSAVESLVGPYLRMLEGMGGTRRGNGDVLDREPLLWMVGTGGTERQVMQAWAQRQASGGVEPVCLVAHPGHNSLAAALEVLARLHQDGANGRILYLGGVDDANGAERIRQTVDDLAVLRTMRAARLGLVGAPSDWLVANSPDPSIVQSLWGPSVHSIAPERVFGALDDFADEVVAPLAEAFVRRATATREPSRAQVDAAVRVYLALRAVVDREELSAITVRCFDLVKDRATTACFALAQLNDEGVMAGCEGDVVSAVGMIWTKALLGVVPWMANVARVDEGEGALWLAHCTVPRSMVREYRIRSHFESGLGVGLEGTFATGPVTMLRIGGARLERIWVAQGQIVQTGQDEELCRTQIRVVASSDVVRSLLSAPLGNHVLVIPGHHAERAATWWKQWVEPRSATLVQR